MHCNLSHISKKQRPALALKLSKEYILRRKPGCTTLENACIIPSEVCDGELYSGGIVSYDGEFQQSSAWHEGCRKNSKHTVNPPFRDETVVYLGCLYHIWGHAITDNLKKIWYLRLHKQEHKCVYVTLNNAPLPQYIYELFALAGVNLSEAEHITETTKFKKIINPDNSIVNIDEERYYTDEYAQTIECIKSRIPETAVGKIYFTRTHLRNNRDIGEEHIEKLFRRKGYKIIAPEEYSIEEQLSMLKGCTAFAATEGSISHSSLFCKPETETTLLRKVDYINPYSCFINQMCLLNVTYIDVHHSTLSPRQYPWRGPFYLYITCGLSEYMGYYGIHIPYFMSVSWYEYRYNISRRIKEKFYAARAFCGIRTRIKKLFCKK